MLRKFCNNNNSLLQIIFTFIIAFLTWQLYVLSKRIYDLTEQVYVLNKINAERITEEKHRVKLDIQPLKMNKKEREWNVIIINNGPADASAILIGFPYHGIEPFPGEKNELKNGDSMLFDIFDRLDYYEKGSVVDSLRQDQKEFIVIKIKYMTEYGKETKEDSILHSVRRYE